MKKINLEGDFGWEITSANILPLLEAANGEDLDVHLASPGGSVFKGIKVYNDFRDYKRKYPDSQNILTVKGLAASMSAYFMMNPCFDMVIVEDNASYMMHNPYGGTSGDYRDAQSFHQLMEGLTDMMAEAFVKKLKKPKDEIRKMLDAEIWAFGENIVKQGFADEVLKTDGDKNADNAFIFAKAQKKEIENRIRTEEIQDSEYQEIAASLKFDLIDYNNDAFIEKLYNEAQDYDINSPYPNEHAARIRDPKDFQENSFRRKNIETGIDIIIGKLKGKTTTTTQAYRFKKDKFTAEQAKKWLKDHNIKYISFEPAKDSSNQTKQTPADAAGKNKPGGVVMTLEEFKAQHPALYDEIFRMGKEAGVKEIQDLTIKVQPYLNNPEYPKNIAVIAIDVLQGKKPFENLDAAVTTADMIKEQMNSHNADKEHPDDTTPNDPGNNGLTENYKKTGIIGNMADFNAEIKTKKESLGMEVN